MIRKWSEIRRKHAPEVEKRIRANVASLPVQKRDLSDIAGTWVDDPAFDAALAEQNSVWQAREDAEPDNAAGKADS